MDVGKVFYGIMSSDKSTEEKQKMLFDIMPPEDKERYIRRQQMSPEERLQDKCDSLNAEVGKPYYSNFFGGYNVYDIIYDCPKCKNKKEIYFVENGKIQRKYCECVKIRRSLMAIKESGLIHEIETKTFENFTVRNEWQAKIKAIAQNYLQNYQGKWFFAGGQSGCGKTHICTAICGELLKKAVAVKYVLWRELVHKFELYRFKDEQLEEFISTLRNAEVLYIDDFLKSQHPEKELEIAFEVINLRYVERKPTIISSELLLTAKNQKSIFSLDTAVSGRIFEMSKGFSVQIKNYESRNFRLSDDII